MLIIPAVDIKDGKCVQLVQGKPGTEQVIIENPAEVAKKWEKKGANILHVINLDGAFGNKERNLEILKEIINKEGLITSKIDLNEIKKIEKLYSEENIR